MLRQLTAPLTGKMKKRISFKIMLSITLLQLLTCLAFAYSSYLVNGKQTDRLIEQFDLRLETDIQIANAAAAAAGGTVDRIDGKGSPVYKNMKEALERVKTENGLENVYMLSKTKDNEQILVLTGLEDDYGTAYPFTDEMKEALQQGKKTVSPIYSDEFGIHKSIFQPVLNSKGDYQGILGIDLDASVIPETSRAIFWTTLTITCIVLAIGFGLTLLIGRIITSPIKQLMKATEKMAEGDLTERIGVKREDEIGKLAGSFGRMSQNLQSLILKIVTTSEHIAATSTQLYHTAGETSSGAQQVAVSMSSMSDNITEVVSSVSESTGSVLSIDLELEKVTEGMKGMQEEAGRVGSQSSYGRQLVEDTLKQMSLIRETMQQSHQAARQLENRSEEISSIIGLITEISQQTNLLALNAAIEAARVGELGKGFAVVADEVKKLADQSARAATSVAELVSGTQDDSRLVMKRITEGSAAVELGHERMKETYGSFRDIFQGIQFFVEHTDRLMDTVKSVKVSFGTISESMQRISDTTEEQAAGTEQVTAVAQEQSAAIQEITNAIRTLSNMAEELRQSVNQFKVK